jgi:hypothetical protein
MFKLGGMTQGTGIMSHVEPRPQYFNGGRIGYQNAGPVQVSNPFTYFAPKNIPQVGISQNLSTPNYSTRGQRLLEKIRSGEGPLGSSYIPFKETIDLDNLLIQEGIITEDTPISERLKARELYKTRGIQGTTDQKLGLGLDKESGDFATGLGEQKITPPPPPSPKKEPKYKETYNLKEQIAKESQEIKDLLKDEDYSKGELALILSAAIGKKGTIAEKIQEATRLALPIAQSRRKEDKDVTLAAYKLAKEKELYNIRFGAGTEGLKNLRAQAEAIARKENRDVDAVLDDLLIKSGESKIKDVAKAGRLEYLAKEQSKINSLANDIRILENQKAQLESTGKNTTEVDKRIAEARKEFSVFSSYPEFEEALPQYKGFKAGGRIMKQVGGDLDDTEETENNDMIASKVSFDNKPQDATVIEKPVEKLSYQQLRDRLPQEITNDVVMLIANSEEALQDFAYIRTQNDVSKFNVKYGVNLVVPPTAS